jgi:hypothetical protein
VVSFDWLFQLDEFFGAYAQAPECFGSFSQSSGEGLGDVEGEIEGDSEGDGLGLTDGEILGLGLILGDFEGDLLGDTDGLGDIEGLMEGDRLGLGETEGEILGDFEGDVLGDNEGDGDGWFISFIASIINSSSAEIDDVQLFVTEPADVTAFIEVASLRPVQVKSAFSV